MSKRVSPTERLRAQIDELFASERDLASALEDVARLSVRLMMQTAVEAEVDEFLGRARYERRDDVAVPAAATAGSRRRQSRRRWARWSCSARSCVKLSSVASSVLTKSARAMIEALIAGERDPKVLAELAQGRMRSKIGDLTLALRGRFNDHHAVLLRVHLDHIDQLDAHIATIDARIEAKTVPFDRQVRHLVTMPGIAEVAARVVIAEVGVDMSVFPTAGHLASWAGLCPGNNESAGKHRSGRTTHGNHRLTETLVQAAWAATRQKDSWLRARYYRLTKRIGPKRAVIAIAHSMLIAIWSMLTNDCDYHDLGGDFYDRFNNAEAESRRLVRRLEHLGHHVTLDGTAAA